MLDRVHIYLLLLLGFSIAGGCASLDTNNLGNEEDESDSRSIDKKPDTESDGRTDLSTDEDTNTHTDIDTETDIETDTETESSSGVPTDQDCDSTNPEACGSGCVNCTLTDKPICLDGECVQCTDEEDCQKGESCDAENNCIDPCDTPTLVCNDAPSPYCSGKSLITSLVDTCDSSSGTPTCTYKEDDAECPYGCSKGECSPPTCFYDENNDGINDVVQQPFVTPIRCWRRCVLPTTWNGSHCTGTTLTYNRQNSSSECGARGYRVPTAKEYTGPTIADGILNNCHSGGPDNLDWNCDSCSQSPACHEMFGDDTGQYWTSTQRTYWFETNYYAAKLSDGTLNFFNTSHNYHVRCIR